ncbi:hypothetical protein [Rhodoferax sp.]|uniref:hypothetical protein n=1 Tax=Rhodoferax sp. TaxID=50421 RepID=UPI0019FCB166|nr:hypothetical protein [Rhodoferax sp.]MBE0473014.1 hypothetical protein [Rhodoferax sp.]
MGTTAIGGKFPHDEEIGGFCAVVKKLNFSQKLLLQFGCVTHQGIVPFEQHQLDQQHIGAARRGHWHSLAADPSEGNAVATQNAFQGKPDHHKSNVVFLQLSAHWLNNNSRRLEVFSGPAKQKFKHTEVSP